MKLSYSSDADSMAQMLAPLPSAPGYVSRIQLTWSINQAY